MEGAGAVDGLVVVMDLDEFGEYVRERGLSEYVPNAVTGELTRLVEWFASRHRGVVLYGLSRERGTEEAVIEIPFGCEDEEGVRKDLEEIARRVSELGASISIAAVRGPVLGRASGRRDAYGGTPTRRRAARLLREIKRAGGGRVVVLC